MTTSPSLDDHYQCAQLQLHVYHRYNYYLDYQLQLDTCHEFVHPTTKQKKITITHEYFMISNFTLKEDKFRRNA